MAIQFITRETILDFFDRIDQAFNGPGKISLIGETSQVVEGWRRFTDEIEFCSAVAAASREDFNEAFRRAAAALEIRATDEFPGEVIPLPAGFAERERPLTDSGWTRRLQLDVSHFDPYAVSFRFIARGGETDYQMVIRYLENGWIDWNEMTARLEALLPEFSLETIQQDPAEFRRRYGGLSQMWDSRRRRSSERIATG